VEIEDIRPNTGHGADLLRPLHLVLEISAHARFDDMIRARRAEAIGALGVIEAVADIVAPDLQAEGIVRLHPKELAKPGLAGLETKGDAFVDLLELIAPLRVIEEVGEVREQIEIVVETVEQDARGAGRVAPPPVGNEIDAG